jgi:integrative and conjugative element protein (TIGR02256 family)
MPCLACWAWWRWRNGDLAGAAADDDGEGSAPPLYLVVGTPSRGVAGERERLTHLVVWRLPPLAELIAGMVPYRHAADPRLAEIGREVLAIGRDWLESAKTAWARVCEAREEIVTRRDAATSASWLLGKRVLVLGAGALGAPIAQACIRGGAGRVVVADRGVVHPGVLVRQPYDDADIGQAKAVVLAERLGRIRPGADVEPWVGDVVTTMFDDGAAAPAFDLVIDATANRTVRAVLERRRAAQRDAWPAVATVLIGHQATRGIATVAQPGASGAGADILRRLSLAARADATGLMDDVVEDFFPDPPRHALFQPEPGCSDVTFVGSAGDVTGLAGQLLTGVLQALRAPSDDAAMAALVVRMPTDPSAHAVNAAATWFRWPNDLIISSADGRHEVRLATSAVAEMRSEARRGARVRTPRVETGGSLLGGFDPAAGVVWVDEATGPPADSLLSEVHFQHGTTGVEEQIAARRTVTARVTTFVGMWHTHPDGPASPSPTDEAGVRELVLPVANAPPRALLLIAGGRPERWRAWLDGDAPPDWYARVVERQGPGGNAAAPTPIAVQLVGVRWWPGGYATRSSSESTRPERPRLRRWPFWLRGQRRP